MKRILTLAMVAMLALCMTLCAVSCDSGDTTESESKSETGSESVSASESASESESSSEEDAPTKISYTVTIKDEDGNVVAGVETQICVGEICKKPQVTDENGVVVFQIDAPVEEELKLQLNNGPEGFEYLGTDGKIAMDPEVTELTVTLKKLPA